MPSHGLQVFDVLLDSQEAAFLDARGAATVAHVVEDEGVLAAEWGEVAGEEEAARDDDGDGAAPDALVVEPDAVRSGDPPGIGRRDHQGEREQGRAHATVRPCRRPG